MLEGLPQLAMTDEVLGVAAVLVREQAMPGPAAEGDALHVAVALVHQMDHLVTWNQRHLTPDLMNHGDTP